jgi:hypothetical protein
MARIPAPASERDDLWPHDPDGDPGERQGDVAVIRTPVLQYRPVKDGRGGPCFVLERETVLTVYRWKPSTTRPPR